MYFLCCGTGVSPMTGHTTMVYNTNIELLKQLTLPQMPYVEVVHNFGQNLFHMAGNRGMAIRYECRNYDTTAQQEFHTLLEAHKLHCRATSCFISLKVKSRRVKKDYYIHIKSFLTEVSCIVCQKPKQTWQTW